MSIKPSFIFTCSMTSGAIQHGVPTNVFLTLFRVTSPPVAKNALTPKSEREKKITLTLCKTLLLTNSDCMNIPFPGDLYSSHDLSQPPCTLSGIYRGSPAIRRPLHFREHHQGDGSTIPRVQSPAHQSLLPTKKVPKVRTDHKWWHERKLNTFPKP